MAAASKIHFTAAEDEKLVEMVAKFDCLYDLTSPLYKNQVTKDNAWKEIAEHVERSIDDCKKRWRNIKDTYKKRLKKRKGNGSSDLIKSKHWPLADVLTFLGKTDCKRDAASNIEFDEDGEADDFIGEITDDSVAGGINGRSVCSMGETLKKDSIPDALRSKEPLLNKRKKSNVKIIQLTEDRRNERNDNIMLRNVIQNRDDDIDVFFKSIAMSVKKLSPELINEAKTKSLQMVIDLERRDA